MRTAIALTLLSAIGALASIQISGLNTVPEERARKMIEDQIKQVKTAGRGSRPLADDASFFLERELRRSGYRDADVQWQFDEATGNITLIVDEGLSQQLGDISISGNVAEVDEAQIRDLVRRSTANRHRHTIIERDGGALPLVEKDIASGLAEVNQLYRSLGYWDSKVKPLADSIVDHDGKHDVHVQIEAGPLHHFRAFKLLGDTGAEVKLLQESLAEHQGSPFTTKNVNAAKAKVAAFYSKRGHINSDITSRPIDHGDEITLEFTIDAGRPFQVASLEIEGTERIRPDFVKKRFAPLVGKPYSPADAEKIYRDLLSIGLFNRIGFTPEEIPGRPNEVNLIITVEEAKARSIGVYGGYGTYDGAILGFIFRENNVFGNGRQFRATGEYNQRGLRGEIGYSDKWFWESPFFFDAKLFATTKDHEGYDIFETGFRASIGRQFGEHYSVSAFATIEYADILEAEIEAADLGLPNYRVGSIGLAHSYDMRDHKTLPRRGFIFDNSLEYASGATGSEVDFLRGSIRFSAYFPITKRTQLSLGARSGFIMPTGDTDQIPINLRYFSGGSTTVRSFRERHLGPSDKEGYPLGGEFYSTFNAEYTVPIAGALKAAVFADAGNLLRDFDDASLDEMHYAVGAGLRYDLPTGPIRLDYGWNMNRGEREPSGTFHVSIGFAF